MQLRQGLFPQPQYLIIKVNGEEQVQNYYFRYYGIDYFYYYILDKPGLSTFLRELIKVDSKWENIGILLEIEPHRLESIKIAEHHNTQNCLREMLKIWLKRISLPPSWSAITDALKYLGEEKLADDLRCKYLQ